MTKTLEKAIQERHSVRAFTPERLSFEQVQSLLKDAATSASGGNLQPWNVIALTGAPLQQVIAAVKGSQPEETATTISYPPSLWEPYRTRRFQNGEELYASLGIGRDNKAARLEQLGRNTEFFGAPVGLFVHTDEGMTPAQWIDLGIYLQTLMLLASDRGFATCAQGFWRRYQQTLRQQLNLPQTQVVAFGVALGYEDRQAPINQWRSSRAPFAEWAQLRGFDDAA